MPIRREGGSTPDRRRARDASGEERELPAWIYERPDGDTIQVIAPRPPAPTSAQALELVRPDRAVPSAIDPAAIRDLVRDAGLPSR